MANDITLSSSARSNLLSLQKTTDLIGKTQERLASGKKVNSAIDDALSFFKSRGLSNRASDLATTKDNISQAISVIKSASQGLESIESVLKQMKALGESAKSSSDTTVRAQYASQFNELVTQIDNIAKDASFNGISLLKSTPDNMTVKLNETGDFSLQIKGLDSTASSTAGLNVTTQTTDASSANSWGHTALTGGASSIDTALSAVDSALTEVRSNASQFGTSASMLEIRRDFTANLINTLSGGASDLVNADVNQESANMLALQTRQQLGTISLSIAQQSEQAILRLF